jgi:translation initiation factor 5
MVTINIRSDVKDPFYRYKMEKLQSKIEGKGNGIKTVIVNLSSVAQSLARPGAYVIKYFGFELGAQTNTNPADDRWIINGAHEASKLQDYLDGFINKFVLCKKCKNPETDVVIKDGRILLDCKACGQRSDVDLRLKLSGFILKNQPKKGKKDKAEKKAARKARENRNGDSKENGHASGGESNSENGSNGNGDVGIEAGSDDEMTRRIKAEAQEIDATPVEVKDDEWTVDMSAEAVRARQQQLPDDLKQKLVLGGDDDEEEGEGGGNSSYDQLGSWILSEAEEKGGVNNVDDVAIYLKAKELGIEAKHRTLLVLVQTIFDDDIVKQIPKRAGMLKNVSCSIYYIQEYLLTSYRWLAPRNMRRLFSEEWNASLGSEAKRTQRSIT